MIPTRHQVSPAIRLQYGERADRLAPFLTQGDPLADDAVEALAPMARPAREALLERVLVHGIAAVPEAPAALRALFAQLDHVPFWFDPARSDRGGAAFLRSGPLGGLVLGMKSLVAGYCSPAGNKPLVFSGRLAEDVPRRLTETGRFVQVVAAPGGLRRQGEGFAAAVKVRLIHAQVRRMLSRSPRWDHAAWGTPVNQFDMAGTVLLFSHAVIEGLRQLGGRIEREEAEDLLHQWRYAGYLLGVRDELLSVTEADAQQLWEMIQGTQAPPDEDSRALARALIEHPVALAKTPAERARAERMVRFSYGLSRFLMGDEYAEALGYPRTRWRFALPALRAVLARADAVRRGVPFGDRLALDAGQRYWEQLLEAGIAGTPVTFALPEEMRGTPAVSFRASAAAAPATPAPR